MRKRRNPRRRLRFGRLALVLLGVVLTTGAVYGLHVVQTQRNAGSLLTRAEQAIADGNSNAATSLLKSYVKLRPTDTDGLAKYAAALEEQAKTKPAVQAELVQAYEKLLRVDPTRAVERQKLVGLYVRAGAYANARSHLATLFTAGKQDDPQLHDLAARCDEQERKFISAAEHLRKVVATDNASPDVYLRLALIVRNELGGTDGVAESDRLMKSLVAKKPNDVKAWLTRAEYRRRLDDKVGARADAEYAFQALPGGADDPDVLQTLSELYLDSDNLESAERLLQKASSNPSAVATRTRLALADVQIRLDRLDTARQTLREAAEKATKIDNVLLEIVDRLIDLKELPVAEQYVEKLNSLSNAGPVGDYLRGRMKLATGEWAAATALLQTAADGLIPRLNNQRFRAYLGIAEAAGQTSDPTAQLAAYDAALRLNPSYGPARLGRAEALTKLGRAKEAEEAYRTMSGQEPAARAAVATMRLAEQLALPVAERRWEEVDRACGDEPYPPEVAVVKARALVARGRSADAVKVLEESAARKAFPGVIVELANLRAALGDRAGALDVLNRPVGERADYRLARARILAGDKPIDWAAIAAVGDAATLGQLPSAERYKLLAGLAEVYVGGGKPTDAIELWKRAAAEKPNDLISRAALFNLALTTKNAALQTEQMAEFERIEGGKDGPVRVTAEAAQAVPGLKPGDPALSFWKERLTNARTKRPSWPLVHHLLGRVDELAGNADAAAESYHQAFDLGDRSDGLVRGLYAALLRRQQYAEAFDVLAKVAREKPLADDLAKELMRLQVAFGDDPGRAVAWANSAEAANSVNDREQVLRADALLAAGKTTDAIAPLKKAVSLNPKNTIAWVALTRLLIALGKEVDAKSVTADAVEKLGLVTAPPGDRAAALVAIGVCHELTGDRSAAEADYRLATAADPTDIPAQAAVVRILARTNRLNDGEKYLRDLSSSAPPAVRRWARRELAFASIDRPDWYGRLKSAIDLIDQNLQEGPNLPEDVRAKAVILGADPFRVNEAVALLSDSAKQTPLNAGQSYQLARLYLRQGLPTKAEAALRDALRSSPVPAPEFLGLLVKLQVDNQTLPTAKRTVERLKQLDPKAPETGVAEARVLAFENKKKEAVSRLVAVAGTADPTAIANFAGPLLEEMNCSKEAEAVYRQATGPMAAIKLAAFLIRQKRAEEAVRCLLPGDGSAPVGLAARLLAGAVRSQPSRLLDNAQERTRWESISREVSTWVDQKLAAAPTDPHLLAAAATLSTVGDDPKRVVPAFERALAAAPNDSTAKANLAYANAVYARDGGASTLALIQSALDSSGPSPALLDTRGLVHLVAGRADAAVRDLTMAYTMEPKPAYAFHLAQAYDLQSSEKPGAARLRDDTLAAAIKRGLTKASLDPREWVDFERLTKPAK